VRFWDSSAIVPLLVRQPASASADRWFAEDSGVVTWTLTPVEMTSALWRLVRENAVPEEEAHDVDARAAEFLAASRVIVDVDSVKSLAQRLLRVHQLRPADALQLGAALLWAGAGAQTRGAKLHTLDERLAAAARREGFHVPASS
jgi:uncharacterized protein